MIIQFVVTTDYLWQALVLQESIRKWVPSASFSFLLTNASKGRAASVAENLGLPAETLCCDDLRIPELNTMRSYYSALEFNAACKVLAIRHQLRQGHESCLFLDADMLALGDFTAVFNATGGKDILLSPHAFAAYPDDGDLPDDLEIVQCGHVNAGVAYFRNSPPALEALEWLCAQTRYNWFISPALGMHAEQQWFSLLPYYHREAVGVVEHRGVNVAYWNLHERALSRRGDTYEVVTKRGAEPLLLFHFSGFPVPSKGRLTRHSRRQFDVGTQNVAQELAGHYEDLVSRRRTELERPDLAGDVSFSNDPLDARIRRASRSWKRPHLHVDAAPGLMQRIGRKLDRLAKR
jgi:hypothetical protein